MKPPLPVKIPCPFLFLFGCVFLLSALSASARAEATKPHPLWGNTILGNSAEPITLGAFHNGTSSGYLMGELHDYASSAFGGWDFFDEETSNSVVEELELDLASADFDGDGDDDVVYVTVSPTTTAGQYQITICVPGVTSDPISWGTQLDYEAGILCRPDEAFESPSLLQTKWPWSLGSGLLQHPLEGEPS